MFTYTASYVLAVPLNRTILFSPNAGFHLEKSKYQLLSSPTIPNLDGRFKGVPLCG